LEEIKITSVLTTIALILIGVLLFELIIFMGKFGQPLTAYPKRALLVPTFITNKKPISLLLTGFFIS